MSIEVIKSFESDVKNLVRTHGFKPSLTTAVVNLVGHPRYKNYREECVEHYNYEILGTENENLAIDE